MSRAGYTQQRSYAATVEAEAEARFRHDAEAARAVGWVATDERWEDGALRVTYEYVGPARASEARQRRRRLPQPGKIWKAAMLIMAALGLLSGYVSGGGLFVSGNMAHVMNGLINALLWVLLIYALFLVVAMVLGLIAFARRQVAS